mgnify:CR=1 FL=1
MKNNKKTFKEWVAFSKEQLEALKQQPKAEQNKKIAFNEVKSLTTHLCSKEIKNRPKEAVYNRVSAFILNEVNNGNGFTKMQVLRIKSSETFPKAFEKKFLESFKKWESENLEWIRSSIDKVRT